MREVELEKIKKQIPERDFDLVYADSPRFAITYQLGRARGLWNFLLALMEAEVDDLAAAYEVAEHSRDLTHLCGLHKMRWKNQRWTELRWFMTVVWHHKQALALRPQLKEYIGFLCENSRVQWGRIKRPMGLMPYAFADEGDTNPRLPWRTADWFAVHRPRPTRVAPLSEFWPYITTARQEEHDLLLMVDRAVPKTFSTQDRGDFCQDLMVEILSGNLSPENLLDELPNFVRAFWRKEPNKYRTVSLNRPVYGESSRISLIDTLVAPPVEVEDPDNELPELRRLQTAPSVVAISERPSTTDMAALLKDGWEANRLTGGSRKTYSEFAAAHRARQSKDGAVNRGAGSARMRGRFTKRVGVSGPMQKDRTAWTLETAYPEELRDEKDTLDSQPSHSKETGE